MSRPRPCEDALPLGYDKSWLTADLRAKLNDHPTRFDVYEKSWKGKYKPSDACPTECATRRCEFYIKAKRARCCRCVAPGDDSRLCAQHRKLSPDRIVRCNFPDTEAARRGRTVANPQAFMSDGRGTVFRDVITGRAGEEAKEEETEDEGEELPEDEAEGGEGAEEPEDEGGQVGEELQEDEGGEAGEGGEEPEDERGQGGEELPEEEDEGGGEGPQEGGEPVEQGEQAELKEELKVEEKELEEKKEALDEKLAELEQLFVDPGPRPKYPRDADVAYVPIKKYPREPLPPGPRVAVKVLEGLGFAARRFCGPDELCAEFLYPPEWTHFQGEAGFNAFFHEWMMKAFKDKGLKSFKEASFVAKCPVPSRGAYKRDDAYPQLQPYQLTAKFMFSRATASFVRDDDVKALPRERDDTELPVVQGPIDRMLFADIVGAGKTLIIIGHVENFWNDPRPKIIMVTGNEGAKRANELEILSQMCRWKSTVRDFLDKSLQLKHVARAVATWRKQQSQKKRRGREDEEEEEEEADPGAAEGEEGTEEEAETLPKRGLRSGRESLAEEEVIVLQRYLESHVDEGPEPEDEADSLTDRVLAFVDSLGKKLSLADRKILVDYGAQGSHLVLRAVKATLAELADVHIGSYSRFGGSALATQDFLRRGLNGSKLPRPSLDEKVLFLDEIHTILPTFLQSAGIEAPNVTRYTNEARVRKMIEDAKFTAIAGYTGTPAISVAAGNSEILGVIKGGLDVAGFTERAVASAAAAEAAAYSPLAAVGNVEGYISYFLTRPETVFAKLEGLDAFGMPPFVAHQLHGTSLVYALKPCGFKVANNALYRDHEVRTCQDRTTIFKSDGRFLLFAEMRAEQEKAEVSVAKRDAIAAQARDQLSKLFGIAESILRDPVKTVVIMKPEGIATLLLLLRLLAPKFDAANRWDMYRAISSKALANRVSKRERGEAEMKPEEILEHKNNEISAFNAGDNVDGANLRVLIADSSFMETSVSLFTTRRCILASIPRTYASLVQQLGRAVRFCGHQLLDADERTLRIEIHGAAPVSLDTLGEHLANLYLANKRPRRSIAMGKNAGGAVQAVGAVTWTEEDEEEFDESGKKKWSPAVWRDFFAFLFARNYWLVGPQLYGQTDYAWFTEEPSFASLFLDPDADQADIDRVLDQINQEKSKAARAARIARLFGSRPPDLDALADASRRWKTAFEHLNTAYKAKFGGPNLDPEEIESRPFTEDEVFAILDALKDDRSLVRETFDDLLPHYKPLSEKARNYLVDKLKGLGLTAAELRSVAKPEKKKKPKKKPAKRPAKRKGRRKEESDEESSEGESSSEESEEESEDEEKDEAQRATFAFFRLHGQLVPATVSAQYEQALYLGDPEARIQDELPPQPEARKAPKAEAKNRKQKEQRVEFAALALRSWELAAQIIRKKAEVARLESILIPLKRRATDPTHVTFYRHKVTNKVLMRMTLLPYLEDYRRYLKIKKETHEMVKHQCFLEDLAVDRAILASVRGSDCARLDAKFPEAVAFFARNDIFPDPDLLLEERDRAEDYPKFYTQYSTEAHLFFLHYLQDQLGPDIRLLPSVDEKRESTILIDLDKNKASISPRFWMALLEGHVSYRLMAVLAELTGTNIAHSNALILRKQGDRVLWQLFEPHGHTATADASVALLRAAVAAQQKRSQAKEPHFAEYLARVEVSVLDTPCPRAKGLVPHVDPDARFKEGGLQLLEHYYREPLDAELRNLAKGEYQPLNKGLCEAWTTMFLALVVRNPDLTDDQVLALMYRMPDDLARMLRGLLVFMYSKYLQFK